MGYFKKEFLEIVATNDRQYLIKSEKNDFVYLNDKKDAEKLLLLLEEIDWKKYKTLQNLAVQNQEQYEKVAKEIRKVAVPKKNNGNYLESLKDGLVEYKLNKNVMVKGIHINDGLAYRKLPDGKYCLDVVYSGLAWMAFESVKHLNDFLAVTSQQIPYIKQEIGEMLLNNVYYVEYTNSVYRHTLNPECEIKEVPLKEKAAFEFDLYIKDGSPEKRSAYIEAMVELNNMYGLRKIKNKLNKELLNKEAEMALKRVRVQTEEGLHSLFVGPPGTGKTQVARLMAKLYWAMGYIEENKLIEVSKEDLISKYVGGTEEMTGEKIKEALGGILFVDEAYMLQGQKNAEGEQDYGKIALEIIMRAMENHRNEFVVIFAGYEKEIDSLLNVNPGLQSRFSDKMVFENYSTSELTQISKDMLTQKGFDVSEVQDELRKLFEKKTKNGVLEGNARSVRVLVEKILKNHKQNIVKSNGSLLKLSSDSVKQLYFSPIQNVDPKINEFKEIGLKELNALVGLDGLKEKINTWTNYLTIEVKRSQITGSLSKMRLHMTFEGSPGTGKTTVARLMGSILKGVGVLKNGHVVEVVGKDLVAGYQGQTTKKVQDIVKQAVGGILFIDEAYSIVKSESDVFGMEAVDALIAEMENKGTELVVILAGYTKEIESLLRVNQGFKSRIAERFNFEDYNVEQLTELFENTLKTNNFTIENDGMQEITQLIENEYNKNNYIDGNGRWVRNLFDKLKLSQANRLIYQNVTSEHDLFHITYQDVKETTSDF